MASCPACDTFGSPPAPAEGRAASRAVVLVGNSNVGKSALFGALTGRYVTVSNYPGTTVELTAGSASLAVGGVRVVDTPGAGSFLPSSEDERVTRDILLDARPHAVVVVGDAKNLERALVLAVQVAEMELPFVLCLNMMDEADERGMEVACDVLAARLGVDVVPTVAVRREGLPRLRAALAAPRTARTRVAYAKPIEDALTALAPLLPAAAIAPRALGLMVLSGDETLASWLRARTSEEARGRIEEVRQRLRRSFRDHMASVVDASLPPTAWRGSRRIRCGGSPSWPPSSASRTSSWASSARARSWTSSRTACSGG